MQEGRGDVVMVKPQWNCPVPGITIPSSMPDSSRLVRTFSRVAGGGEGQDGFAIFVVSKNILDKQNTRRRALVLSSV